MRLGIELGDVVLDPLSPSAGLNVQEAGYFTDLIAFMNAGEPARFIAERLVEVLPRGAILQRARLKLAAPFLPTTILCAGSNYHDHNAEKAGSPTSGKEPEFFLKTADCVVGPGGAILHDPVLTNKLDCETELAIVIGKPGRHISREAALDHVFGYTIVNDVTARDRQVREKDGMVWYDLGRGKAFDTSAPMGPRVVTADRVGDPQALDLKTRINGELRQSSNTAHMIWSCAELIHFFSTSFTLKPGTVIITGTPAGTAWSVDRELGGKWKPAPGLVAATRYCEPGDVVECEIDKLGDLRNTVAAA